MKQSTWIRTGYVLGTVLAVVAVVAGLLWLLGGARAVPTTTNVANVAPNAAAQADLAEAVSAVSQAQQQAATLQNAMNTLTADARGFATTGEQWWLAEWVTEAEQNRTRENALAALEQLGLPAEEIQALRTAVEDDTKLRQADLRALRLVLEAQGVPEEQMPEPVAAYQLIPADEELGNAAKRDLAVTVVFGNDYRQAAARAQAPVESFRTKVAEMDLGDDNAAASGAAATGAAAVGSGADAVTASPARGVGGSGALLLGILGTAAGAVALIALTRLFDTRSHQVVLRYTARLRAAATLAEPGHVTPDGFVEQQELAEAINERDGAVTELLTGLDRDCALLGNLAERLHGHSSAVSASAAGTVATATGAADSAGTVSANVDTVAAGTEEMNASIQEISRSAARASSVAMEGVQAAEAAASTMTQLSESSVRIGEVMKTITAIAEQTNLLALNATIEASRAGEAGKGFGVVANEVKDLASQTGRATQDINERVVGIQGDAEAIAIALTQISEIIARINETQATIASAVEEQTATTNEMSRSVQEAAESARGIADTITTVADGARTGADAAGAAVDEVNGLTDLLARMKSAMHARTGGREFGG